MFSLLFPRKCIFCRRLLRDTETDLCHTCREETREFINSKRTIPFVAHWTAVWYYTGDVGRSIRRFKFYNARGYARIYGCFLAQKIKEDEKFQFDVLAWIPVSYLRRLHRGYDQSQLLAEAVARELNMPLTQVLRKHRHTKPQSRLKTVEQRRANILNAYRVPTPELIQRKRVLILDDVITTGATSSECAKTLLIAGAKEVQFAAIAAALYQ